MNKKLQYILEIIQQSERLNAEQKEKLVKAVKDADKEFEITAFKLERTEKVKKTTAILLEETIEELEQKRKAVEEQNRELEIETALERVRTVAMGMERSEDLLKICEVSFKEFQKLGFENLRNAVIHIPNDEQKYFMDYDYSEFTRGDIAKIAYGSHPIVDEYLKKIRSAEDAYFEVVISKEQLNGWKEFRKSTGQSDDSRLDEAEALYYYLFSIGIGDIGISTFKLIKDAQIKILKRFRNVFDLAYRRYNDIITAEAQTREAEIQLALERVRAKAMAMHSSEDLTKTADTFFSELVKLNITPHRCGFGIVDKETRITDIYATTATEDKSFKIVTGKLKLDNHPILEKIFEGYENQEEYHPVLRGKEISDYYEVMNPQVEFPDFSDDEVQYGYYFYFKEGGVFAWNDEKFTANELEIFRRYATVLSLTYRRYIDLKEAEAQAREAQIEAALERVRAHAMGLRSSEELSNIIAIIFDELKKLGLQLYECGIFLRHGNTRDFTFWGSGSEGAELPTSYHFYFFKHPILDNVLRDLDLKVPYREISVEKDELVEYGELLFSLTDLKNTPQEYKDSYYALDKIYVAQALMQHGFLEAVGTKPLPDDLAEVMRRFTNVIDLTYTRFLDLQKAEAQVREAQIEAALERVRSRSMGMQKSEELKEVIQVVYEQLVQLNINIEHTGFIMDFKIRDDMHIWLADRNEVPSEIVIPYFDSPHWNSFNKAKANGKNFFANHLSFEEKNKFYQDLFEYIPGVPEETKEYYFNCPGLAISTVLLENVGLYIENFSGTTYSAEENKTLMRFGKVFQQTYTRFLDLQKAEAQAREAQIEAALERVRSKTMAMHNSQDVGATVVTLFDEVLKLGLDKSIRVGIGILEGNEGMETWSATSNPYGDVDLKMGMLDMTIHPMLTGLKNAWASGKTCYSYDYIGDDVFRYYEALNNEPDYPFQADLDSLPENEYHKSFFYTEGILFSFAPNPISDEAAKVLDRFAGVFGQTYRRYLDLQKAEAQAREAQIEASLERVRSKAMSMHSSDDLSASVNVFFIELKSLGITPIRCGVGQIDDKSRTTNLTTTTSSQQGKSFEVIGKVKQAGHPVLDEIFENWKLQKDYFPVLKGSEIKTYYNVMNKQISYPDYPENVTQYGNMFYFKEGFVFAWTENKLSEEDLQIFRRFTSVLSLTYRRYIDLQQAEFRARQAEHQASLDRVRAEIASMRTTDDLEKITPLIWRELTTLGMPFFRCGVFIIDESDMTAHGYLSTPSGKSLGTLHLKIDEGHWIDEAVKHWQKGEIYCGKWDRKEFIAWTQTMIDKGFVENQEHFQDGKEAPENLYLQLLPFAQGMLYVGTKSPLSQEDIKLAKKLADAFGVAYARYEDFQKLEAANHRKSLELEEARQLQLAMLPKVLPQLPNLDIAVYMQTATEVGGDYYDFNVSEEGELTAVIGDATGHGMKAGTIVTITKSLFNSLAHDDNILNTFSKISKVIKDMKFKQLSMCLMMLKIHKSKIIISSAAMPPALIFRKKKNIVEEIELKGMPLGAMENFPYQVKDASVESGDTILLMSDGLPELPNGTNEMYGYDRIMNEFKLVGKKTPEEIIDHLKKTAAKWINGNDPDDDITFVVIKVK